MAAYDSGIEMYSADNEGKSVVAERFIRILKSKIYKHMTAVSKNMYIDKLDAIINIYNNSCHKTIKTKSTNVKLDTCIDFDIKKNDNDPKFKVEGNVRLSKFLGSKMLRTLYHGHMSLKISRVKKLWRLFTRRNYKRPIKQCLGSKGY